LLFLPKVLGLFNVLISLGKAAFGAFFHLFFGVLLEILLSILLAPIRMLAHSRYVLGSLLNLSLTWAGQNRTLEAGWRDALIHHSPGTVLALVWTLFALWLDNMFCYWILPVSVPLMLAAPVSVLTGRANVGAKFERWGFPRAIESAGMANLLQELRKMPVTDAALPRLAFVHAVLDPTLNYLHCALARGHRGGIKQSRLIQLRSSCLQQGPESMTEKEISMLAQDRDSLTWLHRKAWRSSDDSIWGRLICALRA